MERVENNIQTKEGGEREKENKEEKRYTFVAQDSSLIVPLRKEFVICERDIPKGSLLDIIITTKVGKQSEEGKYLVDCHPYKFNQIINFLRCERFDVNDKFDYLGLTEEVIYQHFYEQEEYFRNNMYKDGFENHPINKDPYYDLVEITPRLWKSLPNITSSHENLLFDGRFNVLRKQKWEKIIKNLNLYHREGLFMAGGYPFSCLFGTQTTDVDFFLVGKTDAEEAKRAMESFIYRIKDNIAKGHRYYVTKNSVTLQSDAKHRLFDYMNIKDAKDKKIAKRNKVWFHEKNLRLSIQIITRLYRTYSEVLHGFDIDSCCVGYDGEKIWATKRFIFSVLFGYNTVNFNRLSPVYERRIIKYAQRGLKIYIPGFDRQYSSVEEIDLRDSKPYGVKGLSLILLAEFILSLRLRPEFYIKGWKRRPDYDNCLRKIELERELSDYEAVSVFPDHNPNGYDVTYHVEGKILTIRGIKFRREEVFDKFLQGVFETEELLKLTSRNNASFELEFKVTNPGEQSTGTFHKIVLKDNSIWYEGIFYDYKKQMDDKMDKVREI